MQLLGVALLVAAGVFGFLALRKSHTDTVPFPTVSHPLKVRRKSLQWDGMAWGLIWNVWDHGASLMTCGSSLRINVWLVGICLICKCVGPHSSCCVCLSLCHSRRRRGVWRAVPTRRVHGG